MIIFADHDGAIVHGIPDAVHQGSSNVNEIRLFAPIAQNAQVTAAFMLPDGTVTAPAMMQNAGTVSFEREGAPLVLSEWQYTLPLSVCARYGTVRAQFCFYFAQEGAAVATGEFSFCVARGVPAELPEAPDAGVYAQIAANISALSGDVMNGYYPARALYAWNAAYTYGANEIAYYPEAGACGALVRSLTADNTGNTPYAGGEIDAAHWEEVIHFGSLYDARAAAESSAQNAAASARQAQSAAETIGSYAGRKAVFLAELPALGSEDSLYAVVSDSGEKLFDLYVWDGSWKKVGSADISPAGKLCRTCTLAAEDWTDGALTVSIDGVTARSAVTAVPADGSAADYVLCGIRPSPVEGGVRFVCSQVPAADIAVQIEVEAPAPQPDAEQ